MNAPPLAGLLVDASLPAVRWVPLPPSPSLPLGSCAIRYLLCPHICSKRKCTCMELYRYMYRRRVVDRKVDLGQYAGKGLYLGQIYREWRLCFFATTILIPCVYHVIGVCCCETRWCWCRGSRRLQRRFRCKERRFGCNRSATATSTLSQCVTEGGGGVDKEPAYQRGWWRR